MHFDGHDVFSVAVFHQLHCLNHLLKEFNNCSRAVTSHLVMHKPETETLQNVGHCFDYLRSSLMCCGDTAFEGQTRDTNKPGTLGESSLHMCNGYEKIRSWAQSHRVSIQDGFGNERVKEATEALHAQAHKISARKEFSDNQM
ncbi:hypothetical protein GCG54_00015303 [Colletotrichum gloeosporioides]|uniref:Uncharacterized protein n=1 Tax=Colletotrichum gloeosporioides TaxID=474922 RepID=A0A8H4C8I6_COLGL|nr:uncharacterized protein GCG54_00015303 [Colletotrichum gloeosporioides]KAF3799122.1 hypothetical protein GCG54_00015303 [Colletotrichum gloeosporioides]